MMMFNDIEVTPEEIVRYIAELFIRNMKALDTIQLLKTQIDYMQELNSQIEALRQERNNLVAKLNTMEAENIQLRARVKELEDAYNVSDNKVKKRGKE